MGGREGAKAGLRIAYKQLTSNGKNTDLPRLMVGLPAVFCSYPFASVWVFSI